MQLNGTQQNPKAKNNTAQRHIFAMEKSEQEIGSVDDDAE